MGIPGVTGTGIATSGVSTGAVVAAAAIGSESFWAGVPTIRLLSAGSAAATTVVIVGGAPVAVGPSI